jgi:hypothetical protein
MGCAYAGCDYSAGFRAVERHRHREHGEPKWGLAFEVVDDA